MSAYSPLVLDKDHGASGQLGPGYAAELRNTVSVFKVGGFGSGGRAAGGLKDDD